jgi:hypothetical protein
MHLVGTGPGSLISNQTTPSPGCSTFPLVSQNVTGLQFVSLKEAGIVIDGVSWFLHSK